MINLLIDDLANRIVDLTTRLQMEKEFSVDVVRPAVYKHFLPPKNENTNDDFPLILVRPIKGKLSTKDKNVVTVRILVGAYSEDNHEGNAYVVNVFEVILRGLMENTILKGKFRLDMPIEWEIPEEQPKPEWMGWIDTNWTIPTIRETEVWKK